MSRDRGNRAAGWVADYLRPWWPAAEKTPNGRRGADLLGTPGVSFEIKTGRTWRNEWVNQAAGYPGVCVLVWLPPGIGPKTVGLAFAMIVDGPVEPRVHTRPVLLLEQIMPTLVAGGYAPEPARAPGPAAEAAGLADRYAEGWNR